MRSVFNFGHSEKKAKINLIDSNLERTVLTYLYLSLDIFLHFKYLMLTTTECPE